MAKVVIISAPSGTGKSTIIGRLMQEYPALGLQFSISATSRAPRGEEVDGREYYFLSPEEFRARIAAGDFLEYEEVYQDRYYGTLRSEVERVAGAGNTLILDIDSVGALNVKRMYAADALAIFIKPPSIQELRRRLEGRATDSAETIAERLGKAEEELGRADGFDIVVVNDDLEQCIELVRQAIEQFLSK